MIEAPCGVLNVDLIVIAAANTSRALIDVLKILVGKLRGCDRKCANHLLCCTFTVSKYDHSDHKKSKF